MPPDRLPGAARRDAHLLVVVAGGAARRERVVEPEVIALRYLIRDVRERRRAFVGGNDEIGIVAVTPDDSLGRHDLAVDDIVRDIQQPADESL